MKFRPPLPVFFACCLWAFSSAPGTEEGGGAFFEEKIRPGLVKHCYECHSVEEGKGRGGLRVDTERALQQGGVNGPAVIPRDHDPKGQAMCESHASGSFNERRWTKF